MGGGSTMNFSLILAAFLLVGVAVWLWHLSIAQKTHMFLEALLTPVQYVIREDSVDYKDTDLRYFQMDNQIIQYTGDVLLPKKIYVNDSHSISINLTPTSPTFSTPHSEEALCIQDSKSGKSIILQIPRDSSLEQILEIQLLAAGLIVDGEKRQHQSLTLSSLSYYWNCYFPNSGDHEISLIIRVVTQFDTIELGTIQHSIKVAQLDHLTQRQLQWTGIISGGLGVAVLLQQLGVLQKIVSYIL